MDTIPLIVLLFYAVPEGMLSSTVGLSLVGVRPQVKKMLMFGILFGITAYLARRFSPMQGIHPVIITLCVSVFLTFLFGIAYKKALYASILSFVFVALGELLFTPVVLSFSGLEMQEVLQNSMLRILVTLPQQLFLAVIAIVSYRIRGFHLDKYRYIRSYKSWGS